MITFKKVKVCFLLIFIFFNIFYVAPCYSLSSREDLFKNALDLSSGGKLISLYKNGINISILILMMLQVLATEEM